MTPSQVAKLRQEAERAMSICYVTTVWFSTEALIKNKNLHQEDAAFISAASPESVLWLIQRIATLEAQR